MNEQELKALWQSAHHKMDQCLHLNRQQVDALTRLKAQHALSALGPTKLLLLGIGAIWVVGWTICLGYLWAYHRSAVGLFFGGSMALQVLLTALAMVMYVYQLQLIQRVDYSAPVLHIQEKISKLQISTLQSTRMLWLQLPLWTTFYWDESMSGPINGLNVALQVGVTLCFVGLAIGLYVQLQIKNQHRRWFRWIMQGPEWKALQQSAALLQTLEPYKSNAIQQTVADESITKHT